MDIINYGILGMKSKDFFTKTVLFSSIFVGAAYAQPPDGPNMINTSTGIQNEWEVTLYTIGFDACLNLKEKL